jgi:23S rRNA G2069 N7-methylase RlmK/C1962 C5-methylase RlmI
MSDVPTVDILEARVTFGAHSARIIRDETGDMSWRLFADGTNVSFTIDRYDDAVAAAGDCLAAQAQADTIRAQADAVIATVHDDVVTRAKPIEHLRVPPQPAPVETAPVDVPVEAAPEVLP